MPWTEFIRIRVAMDQMDVVGPQLIDLLNGVAKVPGLIRSQALLGVSSPGDAGLLMVWKGDQPPPLGGRIGTALAETLRQFGLVDHTTWRESGRTPRLTTSHSED